MTLGQEGTPGAMALRRGLLGLRSLRGLRSTLLRGAVSLALGAILVGGLVSCGADDGNSGGGAAAELGYCDVAPILEQYCLRCHGEPLENFAPFALTSWDALQEEYPANSGKAIWESMGPAIASDFMPFTVVPLDPPVAPLPDAEKAQLLEWLEAGAPRGTNTCGD